MFQCRALLQTARTMVLWWVQWPQTLVAAAAALAGQVKGAKLRWHAHAVRTAEALVLSGKELVGASVTAVGAAPDVISQSLARIRVVEIMGAPSVTWRWVPADANVTQAGAELVVPKRTVQNGNGGSCSAPTRRPQLVTISPGWTIPGWVRGGFCKSDLSRKCCNSTRPRRRRGRQPRKPKSQ